MCGIAGIAATHHAAQHQSVDVVTSLRQMVQAQRHRGPDDQGQLQCRVGDVQLALGHRRLSILDLTPAGHQPMTDRTTGSQLIYNGEIYNYRQLRQQLRTSGTDVAGDSDTAVLLALLRERGHNALRSLRGMYAFAYYDAPHARLLLARDPVGIKPLYVYQAAGTLLWASEVRALLASQWVPRVADPTAVAGTLAYGSVPHPRTLVADVRAFPAGHYQWFDLMRPGDWQPSSPRRFWSLPQPADGAGIDEQEAVAEMRSLLRSAVTEHLVADVPVAVFLSGGLDSTTVAAIAAQASPSPVAFTVGFPDDSDFCELHAAQQTAERLGLEHRSVQLAAADLPALAEAWLAGQDQPSMDGLNTYVISHAIRQIGLKVALSGLGGDELFGGYPLFADLPRMYRAVRGLRGVPRPLRRSLATTAHCLPSSPARDKLAEMIASDLSFTSVYLTRRRVLNNRQMQMLDVSPSGFNTTADFLPHDSDLYALPFADDAVASISRLESVGYQQDVVLRDSDANGMAHGLEVRVPLLDLRLVEFAHRMPGPVRLPTGRANKHLLRQAAGDWIGQATLQRTKRGFTLPLRRWMLGPLRPQCIEAIDSLAAAAPLSAAGVRGIWREFLDHPESALWSRALTLVALGQFLRQNRLTIGGHAQPPLERGV